MANLSDRPDASIVAAVLTGNTDAYGVLVYRYRDAYTRFAAHMLGSLEDADDALQLAFVRAYRNLAQCRDPEKFGSWLYQIVVNECRTLGARRAKRDRRMIRDEEKAPAGAFSFVRTVAEGRVGSSPQAKVRQISTRLSTMIVAAIRMATAAVARLFVKRPMIERRLV